MEAYGFQDLEWPSYRDKELVMEERTWRDVRRALRKLGSSKSVIPETLNSYWHWSRYQHFQEHYSKSHKRECLTIAPKKTTGISGSTRMTPDSICGTKNQGLPISNWNSRMWEAHVAQGLGVRFLFCSFFGLFSTLGFFHLCRYKSTRSIVESWRGIHLLHIGTEGSFKQHSIHLIGSAHGLIQVVES